MEEDDGLYQLKLYFTDNTTTTVGGLGKNYAKNLKSLLNEDGPRAVLNFKKEDGTQMIGMWNVKYVKFEKES